MKRYSIVAAIAVLASAPIANAINLGGFYEDGELGDGTTVKVERTSTAKGIKFTVDYEPTDSPTTYNPGCGIRLSAAEADHLGTIYQWAASDVAQQQFTKVVRLAAGGAVTVSRGAVSAVIESVLDDGKNITSINSQCYPVMSDDDAIMVGQWLMDAAL